MRLRWCGEENPHRANSDNFVLLQSQLAQEQGKSQNLEKKLFALSQAGRVSRDVEPVLPSAPDKHEPKHGRQESWDQEKQQQRQKESNSMQHPQLGEVRPCTLGVMHAHVTRTTMN